MTAPNPASQVPPARGWKLPYAGRAVHVTVPTITGSSPPSITESPQL